MESILHETTIVQQNYKVTLLGHSSLCANLLQVRLTAIPPSDTGRTRDVWELPINLGLKVLSNKPVMFSLVHSVSSSMSCSPFANVAFPTISRQQIRNKILVRLTTRTVLKSKLIRQGMGVILKKKLVKAKNMV